MRARDSAEEIIDQGRVGVALIEPILDAADEEIACGPVRMRGDKGAKTRAATRLETSSAYVFGNRIIIAPVIFLVRTQKL